MLLEAKDLRYAVRGDRGDVELLAGVDLSVSVGETVDIIGPSGSGKTTLLRALARLLPGVVGTLVLEGEPAESVSATEWRKRITLLPQITALVPGTVRENLLLPWTLKARKDERPPDDRRLREALDSVGMDDVDLSRDSARLSVGQAARVSLLRVLLTDPKVLLLDEPDASLDDVSAEQVSRATHAFAESGGSVIRVRHLRSDGLASRKLRLEGGHLTEVVS